MMKKGRWLFFLLMILTGILRCGVTSQAGTIYESPYVSFSPDGEAWTTDAGNRATEWYPEDGSADVVTGVGRSLRELQKGEHYYSVKRSGPVPIAKWQVCLSRVVCCHNGYPEEDHFHGVHFTRKPCFKPHFSGWRPICADCGNAIVRCYFYMSRRAAESIDYLELGERISYYYLCPFNGNLEQGWKTAWHTCREISANRYRIVYDANAGGDVYGGYMSPSFHMYDNAMRYEGRDVTPQTRLNPNTYTRIGWTFAGWNTEADGSGTFYEDESEILNLCAGDYNEDAVAGSVTLYAVWRPAEGILEIDPGQGSYAGNEGITSVRGQSGEKYEIDMDRLQAPLGYRVVFDTMGGEKLDGIQGTQRFAAWHRVSPFLGKLRENCYYFCAADGNTDRIVATYVPDAILLPQPQRDNYSFGGWYYDERYTKPAGSAGTEFVPTQNMTLYAQWVELVLTATDNYTADGGRGAVDLGWVQPDGQDKMYKLYQSADGEQWEQIYSADTFGSDGGFETEYHSRNSEYQFTVPYSGFYLIEACGAQGSSFGSHKGGPGGTAAGRFWLRQGERLSVGVGSQEGHHGGGDGENYGNGGGYSSVESNLRGMLLIAGGGGGAGLFDDGGPGGLKEGLVEQGHAGGCGDAGGGGGYLGGLAGEAVAHYHTEGVCNHVHTGDSALGTGCYTQPVPCGRSLQHVYAGTETWYWGGSDEEYCPNCGTDHCTGHERDYYKHICPVHGVRKRNYKEGSPKNCDATVRYTVGCGMTEQYTCGYWQDGAFVSSSPAYGGSNYFNRKAGIFAGFGVGEQEGDGIVRLTGSDVGYLELNRLEGVRAEDTMAPDKVSTDDMNIVTADENTVLVRWRQPEDNGTTYYHRAESYLRESNQKLSVSNITANTLVSGVRGYWYCVDMSEDTCVNEDNGCFVFQTELQIEIEDTEQYLHLLAEDAAGNRSDTVHVPIGGKGGWHADMQWPVYTEQLSIEAGASVYPAEADKTYYVKCDGKTPFLLEYGAYVSGESRGAYQPNHAIIQTDGKNGEKVQNRIYVPPCDAGERNWELSAAELRFNADGEAYIINGGYAVANRSLNCRRLSVARELLLDGEAHGRTIALVPVAGADAGERTVYSDYRRDAENGIWLIGDGEAPRVLGLELLEELPLLDRRQGAITLRVTAEDELSGVKELDMEIENLDNGCVLQLLPDEDGAIVVDITKDIPVFSGDFAVRIHAADNVGNECTLSYGTTEFDLRAEITRVLEPHEPQFKRGESALLRISSWGYADRIEVEFPAEFLEGNMVENQVYVYERNPMYKQEETYSFMIPLYVQDRESYHVTVRAYKGDKRLERYPELTVFGVGGTVLDELRTRLR